jgi:transposase
VTYFVGLDVSLEETALCVVDDTGTIVREGKAATEPEAIAIWLRTVGQTFDRVGLEAGPLSPWLYEELQAASLPVICIEARRMKGATAAMAVKTDRNDARAIAQVMRVGWFTAVHVKTAPSQELRLLLTNRKTLLTSRVTLENEIRGTLKAFGLKVGPVSVAAFEGRVIELTADRPRLQAMVRPMLAARVALQLQYAALHVMVLEAAKSHAVCRRLLTVPGVGPVTALTFATAIDDPTRFDHSHDVGAHLGLTPRKYASGEIDRNGRISKCGDQLAREALFLAAHTLLTRVTSLVDAQGVGHGNRQAARAAPRNGGGRAQTCGDYASHVGRWR